MLARILTLAVLCSVLVGAPIEAAVATSGKLPHRTLGIVTGTAVGGEVNLHATKIANRAAMRRFAADEGVDELSDDLVAAFARHAKSETVWAAVVMIGCDVPPGVKVRGTRKHVTITPRKVEDPKPECLAAMTSVAVVGVR